MFSITPGSDPLQKVDLPKNKETAETQKRRMGQKGWLMLRPQRWGSGASTNGLQLGPGCRHVSRMRGEPPSIACEGKPFLEWGLESIVLDMSCGRPWSMDHKFPPPPRVSSNPSPSLTHNCPVNNVEQESTSTKVSSEARPNDSKSKEILDLCFRQNRGLSSKCLFCFTLPLT